jgi:DNA-binding response OmpR family regulator
MLTTILGFCPPFRHFQLLALLVAHSGRVASREEIRETLWGDQTFVDFDRSINLGIDQIRGALDDDPNDPSNRYWKIRRSRAPALRHVGRPFTDSGH